MIKKIQIELSLFIILILYIFFTNKFDVWIFNFFIQINFGTESDNLKKFFIGITELGDSLWYFVLFIFIFLISYLMKIINLINLDKYLYLKKFSIFSFSYLLLVGIITQIFKHILGRPRPSYAQLGSGSDLNFFTTESALHSFPSGHSSTIIAITIILSLVLPNLRYFFYLCGLLIALSRVVVGAHFFTDVVGGILVAVIVYKYFNYFIKIKYPNIHWENLKIKKTLPMTNLFIIFFVLAIFLTIGPEIDLYISSLFYHGDKQFLVQSYYIVSIFFRKVILPFLLIYIFVFPVVLRFLPIQKVFFGYKFLLSEIIFIWITGMITMLFVVNVILKNMWGRVRPNDILNFGGTYDFTPWYKISNLCTSNCSFVSGDASVGFFLIIFYFITKKNIYLYLGLIFGSFLGFIRIVAGGHFFSDIIFSQIVVTISILASFVLYKKLYDK